MTEPTPAPGPYFELRVGSLYIKADKFPTKTGVALVMAALSALISWLYLGR